MDSTFPPGLLPQGREPGSPRDASGAWRRRPLFWLALAFAAGIAADDVLAPGLPALGGLLISAVLAALGVMVLVRGDRVRGHACFGAAVFAGLAGGAFTHALKARFPGASDVSRRTPAASSIAWMEGAVVEVRRTQVNGARGRELWTLELSSLGAKPGDLEPASGLVQLAALSGESGIEVVEGQRLRVLARLEAPASATLPDIFDRAGYLARQEIRRVGEAARGRVELLGLAPWWRADLHLRRWSGELAARNDERLGPERAALLNALLLGRRENLGPGDNEAFARTGTAHLLAISGLHVQAIAALLGWLLTRLSLSKRRAALAVLGFSIAYACFTGAQPPVVRAVVMIAVYAGGFLFFRAPDPLSTLGAAALGILLFAPGDLFQAGFQLSVLAVLALVTIYPSLEAAWLRWRGIPEAWIVDPEEKVRLRWSRGLRRACFVSLAAWAGSAPAVAWHMGNFTFFSLGTNIVAVPLSMIGMATGVMGMLPGFGPLAPALHAPFDLLLGLNRVVSAWPLACLDVPPPSVLVCLVYAAVMIWIWLGRAGSATLPRMALMLPAAFAALAVSSFFRTPPEAPRLTVFDLGRGRAALVETPGGEAALIDAGGEGQGLRIAENLRRQGLRRLALLVITEDDPDALGGVREILDRIEVRRAVLPRSAAPRESLRALEAELKRRGVPYGPADFSSELRGPGDVRWVFGSDAPESRPPSSGSEALAVRVTLAGASVLFAHARSSEGMKRLLAQHDGMLEASVLRIVPGAEGHWPPETALLIARSGARTLVAGEGGFFPEDGSGMDLAALCASKGLRLLAPRREGSLRLGEHGYAVVEAFKNGKWEEVP